MKKQTTKKPVKKTQTAESLLAAVKKYIESNKKREDTKEKEFKALYKKFETFYNSIAELNDELEDIGNQHGYSFY